VGLKTLGSAVGAEVVIDGRRYINFAGSAYLGLASRQEILDAGISVLNECGSGAPLARSYGVFTQAHQEVELQAARFFGCEAAFYVASGYYFGLVAIAALRDSCGVIFFDELAHFSLREAIAASGLRSFACRPLDAEREAAAASRCRRKAARGDGRDVFHLRRDCAAE
jgi:8-amino-7-oxononanoate synthase